MLKKTTTEKRNQNTMDLDKQTTNEILHSMNAEDKSVPDAVHEEIDQIEKAVTRVIESLRIGGRLIYMGAGTSGRLGILDAVECPPTFGTSYETVQGIIAGGNDAIIQAVEGAEDDPELGVYDLQSLDVSDKDTIIGLASSGRTPYVIGGLRYSRSIGAHTVSISCNKQAEISEEADVSIEVEVGPEVLTGSTRLKSGTAQKMVVNMISTTAMIGLGKVYQNLMVDVQPTNEKLRERAKNIISQATSISDEQALSYLEASGYNPKIAIIMVEKACHYEAAQKRLQQANGFVRKALENHE